MKCVSTVTSSISLGRRRRPSAISRSYGVNKDAKEENGYLLLVNRILEKEGIGSSRITNNESTNNAAERMVLDKAVQLNPFEAQYHLRLGSAYAHLWKEPDYHTKWLPAADISMDRAAYFVGEKKPHLHQELGNYWTMRSNSVYPNNPLHHESWARACWHYQKAQSIERGAQSAESKTLKQMKKEIRDYVWNFYPDDEFVAQVMTSLRPE